MEVVFITIAVQKGLEEIKSALKERGYHVVNFGDYNYPIDAVVYRDQLMQLSFISSNNMPQAESGLRGSYGILLINAGEKNIDEIENILKTRCYSPLF